MKKRYAFLAIALLVGASGCKKKTKALSVTKTKQTEAKKEVNIPVADENIRNFFDDDIDEFSLEDKKEDIKKDEKPSMVDQSGATEKGNDFDFVNDAKSDLKTVYFDFDKYNIRDDQETALNYDIEKLKTVLNNDSKINVVIDGHADHAAGSRVYNMALSERRAKVVADRLIASGIAKERIKIVGRGSEMPALTKEGKVVTGDRVAQWPNRRDEFRVLS